MNLVTIAEKSIRQRWLASFLTALSIALGVALMVAVLVINGVVSRMFNQNATGFDMILGAKGSPMQLVLNTIYFLDKPIENIPYKYYLDMKAKKWVEHAIPFALGDTTEDGKFRIVGTTPEYFECEYMPENGKDPPRKLRFQAGQPISGTFDAVIGARVARAYGWTVGKKFPIAHGGNTSDIHDEKFTVSGVLAPTGLPIDRAVFINYDGFYEIEGHGKSEAEAKAEEKARREGAIAIADAPAEATSPAKKSAKKEPTPDERKQVTAILIQVKGRGVEAAGTVFLMLPKINKGSVAQAVNPIEQIRKLLNDVVGNIRTMLVVMTALIIVVSGVGIFVSIYNSMSDRKREIAIMRALGARRHSVFSVIVAESVLLCLGGAAAGLLLGHLIVFIAGPIVERRSDILIDPWFFETHELWILPAILILAVIVGLVPGITAYRADVARGLSE
jgi:putative ABC transport system permease protein